MHWKRARQQGGSRLVLASKSHLLSLTHRDCFHLNLQSLAERLDIGRRIGTGRKQPNQRHGCLTLFEKALQVENLRLDIVRSLSADDESGFQQRGSLEHSRLPFTMEASMYCLLAAMVRSGENERNTRSLWKGVRDARPAAGSGSDSGASRSSQTLHNFSCLMIKPRRSLNGGSRLKATRFIHVPSTTTAQCSVSSNARNQTRSTYRESRCRAFSQLS